MKPFSNRAASNLKHGLESPISRPSVLNLHIEAKTPDLSESDCDTSKTPVLRRSLGVQHELDVSWCSDMATPQNPHRLPCPAPPNITPDLGITKGENSNVYQAKERKINDNQDKSPLLFDDMPKSKQSSDSPMNIGSLFRKRNTFIYPEPVKIQITPHRLKASVTSNLKKTEIENIGDQADSSPIVFSQRKCKRPKEIRKSLRFTADTADNNLESSSGTDNSCLLENEEDMFASDVKLNYHSKHPDATKSAPKSPDLENHKEYGGIDTSRTLPTAVFATASGKNVPVSSESLTRARTLFEESETSVGFDNLFEMANATEPFRSNIKPITSSTMSTNSPKTFQQVSMTIGFSTASGKNLAISDRALARAKMLFDDLEEDNKNVTKQDIPVMEPNRVINSKDKQLPAPINEKGEAKANLAPQREKTVVGFNTAGGKKLTLSNETIKRAQKWFDSIDNEDIAEPEINPLKETAPQEKKFDGFQTANGRSLNISSEALLRAKKVFEEADNKNEVVFTSNRKDPAQITSVGFQSASGKNVGISEAALKKARALFDDIDSERNESSKNVPISKEALDRVRNLFDHDDTEMGLNEAFLPNFRKPNAKDIHIGSGFNTAGGNSIKVSEKALARAKKLFEDADREAKFQESTDGKVIDHNSRKTVSELNALAKNVSSTWGFSTADGKSVTVSEKALARAEKFFADADEDTTLIARIEDAYGLEKAKSQSSSDSSSESSSTRKRKVDEENTIEEDAWISSPTIGKKKRKNHSPPFPLTPMSGTPLSAFDNAPTCVSTKVLVLRRRAREQQASFIELKKAKKVKVVTKPGRKYESKRLPRPTIKQLIAQSDLRKSYKPYELLNTFGVLASVCLVTSANANSFNFFAWEHFSIEECRSNASGFQLGDFNVILSDDNIVGCDEIGLSFLASQHVDPTLINMEWIRNHYRWIVWKLASMELKFPQLFARNSLTPLNVLEQLKYRYDVEVDHCKRSALKRIIEQDDTAAKTMVLCVAQVRSNSILELTDGWYCIDAHCDPALSQLIENGKIFMGLKLLISGADLVAPGPSAPLEKGSDTYLKISANSTRRAKWDLKLGFFTNPHPFPVSLKSVLPEGGLVSRIKVIIVRSYPVIYMEKAADGKTLFHSERHYRRMSEGLASKYERMMEQLVETIEREEEEQDRKRSRSDSSRFRNLTDEEKRNRIHTEARKRIEKNMLNMKKMEAVPLLKLRIVDKTSPDYNSAIVSVWRPTEELQSYLKEGRCYHLYNVNAAGLRFGELQLNSVKHTLWKEIKNEEKLMPPNLMRLITTFEKTCNPSFKPSFNELDLVGLVVHVGEQQAKSPFQTVVLSDGSNYFGIKCWSSLEEYSLADIVKTGTFLAFLNLQWRTTASRTTSRMPFAFIHEGTLVSSRPALKHVASALDELKKNVTDIAECISQAEEQIAQLIGNTTPQSATPKFGADLRRSMFTPGGTCTVDGRKETPTSTNPSVSRARLLEKYGNPPALSPLNNVSSPHVRQKFKPPSRKSLA